MRKSTKKYFFSVEGETEQWYLEWLKTIINTAPDSLYNVKFDYPIQKDPVKRVKRLNNISDVEIFHIFDRESEENVHTLQFTKTLQRMKEAENLGKKITYSLGYSNFAFELWIVLHKADCNGAKTHRRQYLDPINRAYDEKFENLKEYKHEANFKRVLSKLTLEDVKQAIKRSKSIMKMNEDNGYKLCQENGYCFFKENPSLNIWKCIEQILEDCGLLT